jgi:glutaredoxin
MTLVEVYSKHDCHLCDVAKEVLMRVQKQHPFELKIILMQEGDARYNEFKERIPVVYINNTFAFQYRIPKEEFIKKLHEASMANRL